MLTAIFRCAGQARASLSAASITVRVSGPTSPVASATSMKVSASRKPRVGERQRASASNPTSSRDVEVDQRLEEGYELAALDAEADILLELQALGQLALQLLVEPGEAVPAGALGGIERDVALAEDVLLALPLAEQRQADGGRDLDLGAAEIDGSGEPADDRPCHFLRRRRAGAVEQHRELVAADPRAAGGVGRGAGQGLGDDGQQTVAGEVAVKVVDPLEMVEVEEEQDAAALRLERFGAATRNNSRRLARPVAGSVLALRRASRSASS